ncbi:esterase/lipase family protein [Paenibacillus puerhi]|uniref:esterase/lipase family protein n=1 Tax=Paenibacillus puerhi TaxID=2692622 RepID=UPI0013574547|nr:alpha/beta hydrolase [Paenibacillus puerhi]
MLKKLPTAVTALVLALSLTVAPVHAGIPTNPNTGGIPGSWTSGTSPAAIDPNKPAILFVHGLNGSAKTWYDGNDMYQKAYDAGYQTAFINLHDITGTSQSMWDNGELLAGKIKEISQHFGKKLVIVAHSKGGVDTQSALVHYNAYPYVSNVITLGSPHHGSQLADLAYSDWAGWLATAIGYQSPGTASVQTSYMSYFRSVTDNHVNAGKNKVYTFAGNNFSNGSFTHFLGGLYLEDFGPNDGVVTVSSAHLPGGKMVNVGNWNHTSIKTGTATFNLLKPYLVLQTANAKQNLVEIASPPKKVLDGDQSGVSSFIRGGQHSGSASETFTVENAVYSVKLDWIGSTPLTKLDIVAPDGSVESVPVQPVEDTGIFAGAWHHTATLSNPSPGEWTITAGSDGPAAYLFTAAYEAGGPSKVKVKRGSDGKKLKVEADGLKNGRTQVQYSVDFVETDAKSDKLKKKAPKISKPKRIKQKERLVSPAEELAIPTVEGAGIYNVTAEIEGETESGHKFRRTLVKSIYVDEQGNTYSN